MAERRQKFLWCPSLKEEAQGIPYLVVTRAKRRDAVVSQDTEPQTQDSKYLSVPGLPCCSIRHNPDYVERCLLMHQARKESARQNAEALPPAAVQPRRLHDPAADLPYMVWNMEAGQYHVNEAFISASVVASSTFVDNPLTQVPLDQIGSNLVQPQPFPSSQMWDSNIPVQDDPFGPLQPAIATHTPTAAEPNFYYQPFDYNAWSSSARYPGTEPDDNADISGAREWASTLLRSDSSKRSSRL